MHGRPPFVAQNVQRACHWYQVLTVERGARRPTFSFPQELMPRIATGLSGTTGDRKAVLRGGLRAIHIHGTTAGNAVVTLVYAVPLEPDWEPVARAMSG